MYYDIISIDVIIVWIVVNYLKFDLIVVICNNRIKMIYEFLVIKWKKYFFKICVIILFEIYFKYVIYLEWINIFLWKLLKIDFVNKKEGSLLN